MPRARCAVCGWYVGADEWCGECSFPRLHHVECCPEAEVEDDDLGFEVDGVVE